MHCTLAYMIAAFRTTVLNHIAEHVSPVEWARMRSIASIGRRERNSRLVNPIADGATPSRLEIVQQCTLFDWMSVSDAITKFSDGDQVEIGFISGAPIYWLPFAGIYIWGPTFDSEETISLCLTSPAEPCSP